MTDILLRPFVALQIAVHELREREDGQTTTEYAILLGFLAIAIIVALFFLRDVLASCSRTPQQRLERTGAVGPKSGRPNVDGHESVRRPGHPSTGPAHTRLGRSCSDAPGRVKPKV